MSGTRPARLAAVLCGAPGLALCTGLSLLAAGAMAATVVHITQKGRAFDQKAVTIAVGDTLAFSNNDEFIHQIFVGGDSFVYDSAEQVPGQTIQVTFPSPGRYVVNCHIHPKMRLDVTVQ
ncbi:cupredoxin domain-containing protein [Zavarzinia sp. CC-PAN008]|uniref:cupredoxin domain-containing protein n=1 Tax=Zavarzinia sp. CC-PAN008 TaxID=3243332 RepID=UPI003F748A0A